MKEFKPYPISHFTKFHSFMNSTKKKRKTQFIPRIKIQYSKAKNQKITRRYLRLVVLISSLVSLVENNPSLFTMSSHFTKASKPFFTTSYNFSQISHKIQNSKTPNSQNKKNILKLKAIFRELSVPDRRRSLWRLNGSYELVRTVLEEEGPPFLFAFTHR